MINQLNVIIDPQDNVEGYTNVEVKDINQVTNGYVNNIIFTNIDKIEQEYRDTIFIELIKKISHGGTITVKFLNPEALAQKIKYGNCSGKVFSALVTNIKSSWLETDFMSLISGLSGFDLIKHFHEDVYSIAVLEKVK